MMQKIRSALICIDNMIEKGTIGLLVASLFSTLFLMMLVMIGRFFNSTFLWADPLVRHLVFLGAFLGGILATGKGQHIAIDIIAKYFQRTGKKKSEEKLQGLVFLLSSIILIWQAKSAIPFVKDTFIYEKEAFLGIHRGYLVSIIPLGFAFISFRFFVTSIKLLMPTTSGEKHA